MFLLLYLLFSAGVSSFAQSSLTANDEQTDLGQGWQHKDDGNHLVNFIDREISALTFFLQNENNLSKSCQHELHNFSIALQDNEEWALHMLDSVDKFPSGIMEGNIFVWPGHIDQCLSVDIIPVQYCLATVKSARINASDMVGIFFFPNIYYKKLKRKEIDVLSLEFLTKKKLSEIINFVETDLSVGICFPEACSAEDITEFIKKVADKIGAMNASVAVSSCQTASTKPLDGSAIAIITILSVCVFIVFVATAMHTLDKITKTDDKEKDSFKLVLYSFSIYANGSIIFATKKSGISCLHGLRFLSMIWIILLHTYSESLPKTWNNFYTAMEMRKDFLTEIILNGNVAVDTFYCISGLLVSYVFLNKIKKTTKTNWLTFYLHRYLRLTPVYAIIIGVAAGLFPYFGYGPRWNEFVQQSEYCKENWWLNLLYVSNIFNRAKMCQPHCWFLATDMQLFAISPIVLIFMYKKFRIGLIIAAFLTIISCIADVVVTYEYDLPATSIVLMNDPTPNLILYSGIVYIQMYARVGPYLVGMITGYILAEFQETPEWLTNKKAIIGWILSTICNLSIIFGLYHYISTATVPSLLERCLYSSLSRTFWAMGIAWIVLACYWGYGGIINFILSWNIFQPLGKLTYCAYIIHYNVIKYFFATRKSTFNFDHWITIDIFLGITFLAYFLAVPFTLVFEVPVMQLEQSITNYLKNKPLLEDQQKQYQSTSSSKENSEVFGISNLTFEEETNDTKK